MVSRYEGLIFLFEEVCIEEVVFADFWLLLLVGLLIHEVSYVCVDVIRAHLLVVKLAAVFDAGPVLRLGLLLACVGALRSVVAISSVFIKYAKKLVKCLLLSHYSSSAS